MSIDDRHPAGVEAAAAVHRLADLVRRIEGLPEPLTERQVEVAAGLGAAAARLEAPVDDLLVVLVGPTGSGTSSVLNAIAGREVSRPGVLRPTTSRPVVWTRADRARRYRHHGLPGVDDVSVVPGEAPILDRLTFVDAPDPDSLVTDHAVAVAALVGVADLVVPITTPARYADAVPWDVVRRIHHLGIPAMPVLNRVRDDREGRLQVGHLCARAALDDVVIEPDEVLRLRERPGIGVRPGDVAELVDVLAEVGRDDADEVAELARHGAAADAIEAAAGFVDHVDQLVADWRRSGRRTAAAAVAERHTVTEEFLAGPPGAATHGTVRLRLGPDPDEAVLAAAADRLVAGVAADLEQRFGGDPTRRADQVRTAAEAAGAEGPADVTRLLLATTGTGPTADTGRGGVEAFLAHLAGLVVAAPMAMVVTVPEGVIEAIGAARRAVDPRLAVG